MLEFPFQKLHFKRNSSQERNPKRNRKFTLVVLVTQFDSWLVIALSSTLFRFVSILTHTHRSPVLLLLHIHCCYCILQCCTHAHVSHASRPAFHGICYDLYWTRIRFSANVSLIRINFDTGLIRLLSHTRRCTLQFKWPIKCFRCSVHADTEPFGCSPKQTMAIPQMNKTYSVCI